MRKKIFILFLTLFILSVTAKSSKALFSDTVLVKNNSFSTGTLDLKVNDSDGPIIEAFAVTNIIPGERKVLGSLVLKNTGTLAGNLNIRVNNVVSRENSLLEPEVSSGDIENIQIDNTESKIDTGDGELWDQLTIKFCLETGINGNNGVCDNDDVVLYTNYNTPGNDYSLLYNLPVNSNLASVDYTILPAQSVNMVLEAEMLMDESDNWGEGMVNMSNNQAMSDSVDFDLLLILEQL